MRKLLWLLLLLALCPAYSHAQGQSAPVIGVACGASGINAISTTGVPVVCTGSPLVWTVVGGGGSSSNTVGGIFSLLNYGGVDDDSTDNCANGSIAAFNAAINGASGPGQIQAIIPKGASGKAFKLATNANSCAIQLTNSTVGITLYLQGNLDCAQTAVSCIQVGPTGQAAIVGGEHYTIQGGGSLFGGANLTKAGIYVEPGVDVFDIGGLYMGGPSGSSTNLGFGANANVSTGSCTNWGIFIDTPIAGGFVHDVFAAITSNTSTSGGCGFANPAGGATGSNTVAFTNNTIATTGFAGGVGACGSIGLQDGGSYGTADANNIYGFGIPVQILGIGHTDVNNQIDAAQCISNGVAAAFQIGQNGSGGAVGPITLVGNKTQLSAAHTLQFLNLAGGSTATIAGMTMVGNQNVLPSPTNGTLMPTTLNCTISSANGNLCEVFGNFNMTVPAPTGSTQTGWFTALGQAGSALGQNLTANLGNTAILASAPGTRNMLVYCQVIITTQATTSSTLPVCNVNYTDALSGATVTRQVTPTLGASATGGCSGTAVTNPPVGTSCTASLMITPTNATAINMTATGYASSGATAMQYLVTSQAFTW